MLKEKIKNPVEFTAEVESCERSDKDFVIYVRDVEVLDNDIDDIEPNASCQWYQKSFYKTVRFIKIKSEQKHKLCDKNGPVLRCCAASFCVDGQKNAMDV